MLSQRARKHAKPEEETGAGAALLFFLTSCAYWRARPWPEPEPSAPILR